MRCHVFVQPEYGLLHVIYGDGCVHYLVTDDEDVLEDERIYRENADVLLRAYKRTRGWYELLADGSLVPSVSVR